jgi:hypothetical protein
VQYLDANHHPMEHRTHRGGGYGGLPRTGRLVRLAPNGKAQFTLSAESFDVRANKNCPVSTYLAVYPPDETHRMTTPIKEAVCGDTVYESPVERFQAP